MSPRVRPPSAWLPPLLAAGALLAVLPSAAPAASPPWTPPTRLDPIAAIDLAVDRNTAAWLRPTGKTTATLVWWSTTSGGAIATDARLQPDPTRLTLGADATGQPAAIVEYAKTAPRIYRLRLPVGSPPPGPGPSPIAVAPDSSGQILPVATTPGGRPHAFGLRAGRISFGRRVGTGKRKRDAIWLGTVDSPEARVISRRPREPRRRTVVDTALGHGQRIAYTAIVTRGQGFELGQSWWISPGHRQPRPLPLYFGGWEGGTAGGSRITVRGDGTSASISVFGSLGDDNGAYLFDFRRGLARQGYSGDPAWLRVRADGSYANWPAVERGDLPQPNSSLLLDDGGYVGYVANQPFPGFDEEYAGEGLPCPRGATKPRCAVWWRASNRPAPAVPHDSPGDADR